MVEATEARDNFANAASADGAAVALYRIYTFAKL